MKKHFDITKVSELMEALKDFRLEYGDLPVLIDSFEFYSPRSINSVNLASSEDGKKYICLNNYE